MSKKIVHPLVQTANLMIELGPQWVSAERAAELAGYLREGIQAGSLMGRLNAFFFGGDAFAGSLLFRY